MIAAGLTNRQIAERLFIAKRTVDTHVAHIPGKLDCTNRARRCVQDRCSERVYAWRHSLFSGRFRT